MDIKEATFDELEEELKRRKIKREAKPQIRLGEMKELEEACKEYIDDIHNGEIDIDTEHIFEAALTMFYGNGIWDWLSKKQEGL